MGRRPIAMLAAVAALVLVVAGCGSDEGSDRDQAAEVAALVEESVAFEDPVTICEQNFTEHTLEENHDGEVREARVEDCADDEPGGLTEIEVSEVEVDGDTATARVTAEDELDGELADFTVELVDEGGWKVDGVR